MVNQHELVGLQPALQINTNIPFLPPHTPPNPFPGWLRRPPVRPPAAPPRPAVHSAVKDLNIDRNNLYNNQVFLNYLKLTLQNMAKPKTKDKSWSLSALEDMAKLKTKDKPLSSSLSPSRSTSSSDSETKELELLEHAPPFLGNNKRLSKQLSLCEARDIAWERRRCQIVHQERKRNAVQDGDDLTDEDLNELKGSIELGFGFNEEDGQRLCNTLPALDLYFAVNRQYLTSPISSPGSRGSSSGSSMSLGGWSSSFGSPTSESNARKICSPGDNPQQVKTKLRLWAQAVACSVMQSS